MGRKECLIRAQIVDRKMSRHILPGEMGMNDQLSALESGGFDTEKRVWGGGGESGLRGFFGHGRGVAVI